jgi:signal transduction histidine kinase
LNPAIRGNKRKHPATVEIAMFRAVQEGLTNIHRYAGATSVKIARTTDASSVQLTISDNGRGMPRLLLQQIREGTANPGVGIAGMKERLRELNGVLHIDSSGSGTTLIIVVPAAFQQLSIAMAS